MTRFMQKELEGTGYELVTQSEDGNAVKAQQIMSTMLADKFSFIAKADGVPPKPFEELATQASDQGTLFQNHAVQAVGGAGQNIMFDHAAAGQNIGHGRRRVGDRPTGSRSRSSASSATWRTPRA